VKSRVEKLPFPQAAKNEWGAVESRAGYTSGRVVRQVHSCERDGASLTSLDGCLEQGTVGRSLRPLQCRAQ
jgi:hypothetical protein